MDKAKERPETQKTVPEIRGRKKETIKGISDSACSSKWQELTLAMESNVFTDPSTSWSTPQFSKSY